MKILSLKGKWLLTLTCAMYMAMSAVNAFGAYLSGKTLECAELGNLTGVVQLCLIKLGLLVFSYLLTGISLGIRLAYLSNGELGIKDSIVHNLLRRPFSEFRRENSAFYLNLINTDTDMYVSGFLWNIPLVAHTVASMVLSAILLWILHPFMLAAALAMAALPLLVTKPFANMRQKSKTAYSEASENYTNVLKETVEGCGAIRSNGREQACEDRGGQFHPPTRLGKRFFHRPDEFRITVVYGRTVRHRLYATRWLAGYARNHVRWYDLLRLELFFRHFQRFFQYDELYCGDALHQGHH